VRVTRDGGLTEDWRFGISIAVDHAHEVFEEPWSHWIV
jgi:hypothetical protein